MSVDESSIEEKGLSRKLVAPFDDMNGSEEGGCSPTATASKEPGGDRNESGNSAPARDVHGLKWLAIVSAILSTTFLFALDTTIVADIQPAVVDHYGEVSKLAWLGAGFALGSAATILPWSKAYGIANIKYLYITTVALFEVGSAVCGSAPTFNALIVGRVIAGFGASGMYVGCITLLSVLTSPTERPLYLAFVGLVWGIGTVLGPVIGGAFTDSSATWRWSFYINLCIGALFSPIYIFMIPSIDFQKGSSVFDRVFKKTDWVGNVLFAGAMCCLVMALSFGGTLYEWNSGSEIALWVMTGVLFILFGISQIWTPLVAVQYRLYPVQFFRRPLLLALQLLSFLAAFSLLLPTYYIPLYFQFAKASSAIDAAVHLLPFIAALVVFSLLNGALMAKLQYYMPWYLVGGVLITIGSALMYTISSTSNDALVYGYSVLIGAGTGCFLQASFTVTEVKIPPEQVTDAVGFVSLGQSVGIVVSLSIAGAVFQNRALHEVARATMATPLDPNALRQALAGATSGFFTSLPPSVQTGVLAAIVKAMDDVYAMLIAAGAIVVVVSCFLPRTKLF